MGEPVVIEMEATSARLYTGPLFVKYNGVLRGLNSEVPFLVNDMVSKCCAKDVFEQYMGGAKVGDKAVGTLTFDQVRPQLNTYTTTVHVINSAIVKLSKLSNATKVYRGVSGRVLPKEFWEANAFGVRGGIDGAFMSTTTDREVAMQYASSGKEGVGFVFEIQQGMIDRGADICFLSQYPHERETLFNPLTGLEVQSVRVEDTVMIVSVKLSINLGSLTIEQGKNNLPSLPTFLQVRITSPPSHSCSDREA